MTNALIPLNMVDNKIANKLLSSKENSDDLLEQRLTKDHTDSPLEYHFGCSHCKDPDNTPVADPEQNVKKILEYYKHTFNIKPREPIKAYTRIHMTCQWLATHENFVII
jgi:hypothetical protein